MSANLIKWRQKEDGLVVEHWPLLVPRATMAHGYFAHPKITLDAVRQANATRTCSRMSLLEGAVRYRLRAHPIQTRPCSVTSSMCMLRRTNKSECIDISRQRQHAYSGFDSLCQQSVLQL